MPQGYFYPQYYNTSTTTSYQIIQPVWTTSGATTVQQTGWYPQNGWYQTTTAITQDQVWQTWINSPNVTWGSYAQTRIETPEEMEARREAREQERRDRMVARARARTLLGEFLSDEQKVELERHGRFHVTGSRGRRYCIRAEGQAGNVDLLKPDGSLQAKLCCHPRQGLPDGDAWLMQMIEIRHDEDHFLRTANVHRGALPVAA
jgi:hypothetical protein